MPLEVYTVDQGFVTLDRSTGIATMGERLGRFVEVLDGEAVMMRAALFATIVDGLPAEEVVGLMGDATAN